MAINIPPQSRLRSSEFIFGVATAAFQIEGATETDGRLPSIWDTFCATPGKVFNGDSGRHACNHYHLWQEDIQLIKSLGVDAYRLSISWPRVMDQDGNTNPKGLEFYHKLLTELKKHQIKAFVTLYHWDLPQHLEDKGGWLNRQTCYEYVNYVDVVTRELHDLVDTWTTFNEPFCSAILGYEYGIHAPGLSDVKLGRQAAHHILLAHGLAMPVIRRNCPTSQAGIVLNMNQSYPASKSTEDQFAALVRDTLDNQFFISPILLGHYPKLINTLLPNYLPAILPGDMEIICAPIDYLGLNFYTCNHNRFDSDTLFKDVKKDFSTTEHTDIGWEVAPHALTELLTTLNQQYTLPPIYITENGAACADKIEQGVIHDTQRVRYLNNHLNALDAAIEQGVEVKGYFAWSLMDNFEWAEGYSKRFGLVYVDYETQQRSLKQSGYAYRDFLMNRAHKKHAL